MRTLTVERQLGCGQPIRRADRAEKPATGESLARHNLRNARLDGSVFEDQSLTLNTEFNF